MAFAPGSSKSIWNFDPRSIPGCQTWLDASDSNTITYSSGSNVSIWKDKAPYGNNARRLQGTPIRVSNAMNGLPAMYLDGSNATSAAFTGTCPPNVTNQLTVFAVFTVESGVQDAGRLFSLMYPDYQNPNSMMPLGYNTGANTLRVERNSSGYNATSNALTFGTPTLAACVVNGATTTIHMNGTQILSTSTVSSNLAYTYYTIGCFGQARGVGDNGVGPWNGYVWKGYVGEIILYSNALSTAQRQQVEGYLTKKWKLGTSNAAFTSPSSISGLRLWLDAQDASTVTTSGGLVTNVADKSSNGWVLSGANGFSYPNNTFNGSYPSFYGSNPYNSWTLGSNASLTFTQPFTVFFVAQRLNLAAATYYYDGYVFDGLNSTNRCYMYGNFYVAGALTNSSMNVNVGTTTPVVVTTIFNTSNSSQYLNGTTFSSNVNGGTSNLSSGIRIANGWNNGNSWVGHFCELVIYNKVVSTTERQQMEYYLGTKWGLLTSNTFTPSVIPVCLMWFDAADTTNIIRSGTQVTIWSNKGTSQGVASNKTGVVTSGTATYNGRNIVQFPPSTNLGFTTTIPNQPRAWFAVFRQLYQAGSPPAFQIFGAFTSSYDQIAGPDGNTMNEFRNSIAGMVSTTSATTGNNLFRIYNWTNSAASTSLNRIAINGTSLTLTDNSLAAGYGVNNIEYLIMNAYAVGADLAELICINGEITVLQRQQMEYYLAQKWGIAGPAAPSYYGPPVVSFAATPVVPYLPTTHPFYSIGPGLRTFRPIDIDGCALWLDAYDATTLTLSGSNVTQWRDKSGNAYHAVGYNNTATYDATGLNSKPALAFSSTKSMVSPVPAGTFPTAVSTFVVYQFSGAASSSAVYTIINRTLSQASAFAAPFSAYQNNGQVARYIGNGTTNGNQRYEFTAGTIYTNTTPTLYYFNVASNANTTWNESVNGTTTAYTLTLGTAAYGDTASNVCIGGRLDTAVFMNGFISEVIMYNTTLTTAQRQQVEGYLANKWKITIPTVGVSSTTPSLTNCKLWLDGADILGTGAPAPATITTWADKSGTSNTVTANSLSVGQAIASSPMGPFMNGASYFSITGGLVNSIANVPFVIFVVETLAVSVGTPYFFGNDTVPNPAANNALHLGYRNSGNFTFAFYGNDIEVYQAFSNAVTRVWAFYMPSSGNRTARLNGSIVGTGNTTKLGNFNSPVIGRAFSSYDNAYFGTISEILVYNADIGVPAIQTVESYLMAKWQPGTLVPKFTIPAGIALPFSPLQISGSCLWLDANDPAGTGVQPSAGALATWTDKSGSNNHMTAAGTTPTFSNVPPGAVTFGGAGYYSKASAVFSNIYTAFFVYKQTAATGPLYTTGASSGSNGLFPNEAGTTYFTRGDSTWYTVSSPFTSNVTNLAGVSFSSNAVGSNQSLFYNGSNVVTTTQANTITYTNLLIGSRQSGGTQYFTGSIYEVLAYGGTLTTNERQRVEGYLAQKWKV